MRSRSVIGHRREDRGQSVVGWNLTTLASPARAGRRWTTDGDARRYSLAVRAPLRAVRVPPDPLGGRAGRAAPRTYDLTR
ncbi:Uncharacterised protein [Mycobacterium tuberculosis]|nr:Uncharacterised protein [Mycobacterium tuberculosis]